LPARIGTYHNKAPKNERFIDGAFKTRGIIYFHVETWMLFALRYQNICILHWHLWLHNLCFFSVPAFWHFRECI